MPDKCAQINGGQALSSKGFGRAPAQACGPRWPQTQPVSSGLPQGNSMSPTCLKGRGNTGQGANPWVP